MRALAFGNPLRRFANRETLCASGNIHLERHLSVIDEFLTRYCREIDYYEQVARIAGNQAKAQLESAGIRAIVTDRAKSQNRLAKKVKDGDVSKNYQSVQEIQDDIVDIAGVRIALYFPKDREEAGRIITSQFELTESPKEFPEESMQPSYEKRFSGYWATHYRVKLRCCMKTVLGS